jgi:DNA-binding protein HU-beta
VNRRDLIQAVSTQTGVERRQVDSVLQGFTTVVTAVVSKGEPVSISGFAKFVKVDRPARMGRNPQTQQPVRIKASKRARITPLKGFKDAVVKTSLAPKLEKGVWPPAPPAKKTTAKKTTAKKTTAKGTTARKAAGKAGARKTAARKSTARKSTARKSTARKTTAKRPTKTAARKSPARKTTARKSTARKSTARKTAPRKTAARKAAKR